MEKTRVAKGEKYWYIVCDCDGLDAEEAFDNYLYFDKLLFESGNYFTSPEEAGQMVRKLRAVLNGAEVIEMLSEEEIKASQVRIEDEVVFNIRDADGTQLIYCTAINKGAELMADWFKDKIVK